MSYCSLTGDNSLKCWFPVCSISYLFYSAEFLASHWPSILTWYTNPVVLIANEDVLAYWYKSCNFKATPFPALHQPCCTCLHRPSFNLKPCFPSVDPFFQLACILPALWLQHTARWLICGPTIQTSTPDWLKRSHVVLLVASNWTISPDPTNQPFHHLL